MSYLIQKYEFTKQDCNLTLKESLQEYYNKNPGFTIDGGLLGMDKEIIQGHDVAHVVFGLGTSSAEELQLEFRTVFGCKIGAKKYTKIIKDSFILELFKTFGIYRLIKRFILTFPKVIKTIIQSIQMKKRWPHYDYNQYLNTPLSEIRKEFGIRLIE